MGQSPHEWYKYSYKRDPTELSGPLPPCENTVKRNYLGREKGALIKHQICQCHDLGLPSLQNCKKEISVAYKPPSLGHFMIAA